jgi:hypothetical protein
MLSSILQQINFPLGELVVNVACMKLNGDPKTEAVASAFKGKGLDVRLIYPPKTVFGMRGYVRNLQIKDAAKLGATWIYFADSDNVYHPLFVARLREELKLRDPGGRGCVFSREKFHTDIDVTGRAVEQAVKRSLIVPAAFETANYLPKIQKRNKPVAGGSMQVCGMAAIAKYANGVYVPAKKSRDQNMLTQGQRAKSDIQFRKQMGGSRALMLPFQIHLNHARDKEVGKHLEEQR